MRIELSAEQTDTALYALHIAAMNAVYDMEDIERITTESLQNIEMLTGILYDCLTVARHISATSGQTGGMQSDEDKAVKQWADEMRRILRDDEKSRSN